LSAQIYCSDGSDGNYLPHWHRARCWRDLSLPMLTCIMMDVWVRSLAVNYRLFSGCWSSCHCPANEHRHLTPNRTNPDNHFGWVEVGNHFLQYDIEEAADEKPFIADNPCSTIGQAVRTKPVTSRKLGRHLMSSGWIPGTPPQCQRFELVER